jgi:hypothetical protein
VRAARRENLVFMGVDTSANVFHKLELKLLFDGTMAPTVFCCQPTS